MPDGGGGGDHNKKVRILSVCLRQYAVFLPRPTLLESLQPVQQFIRFRHLLARASENVGVYVHAMPITGDGRLAFHTIATLLPQIGFLIIEFAVFLIDDVLDELHRRLCSDQEPVAVPIQIDELLLIRITAIHENQRRLLGNPDVRPHLAEIVQCTDVGNVACVVFDVYHQRNVDLRAIRTIFFLADGRKTDIFRIAINSSSIKGKYFPILQMGGASLCHLERQRLLIADALKEFRCTRRTQAAVTDEFLLGRLLVGEVGFIGRDGGMHGQIDAGHGQLRIVVEDRTDILQHAVRIQDGSTKRRCANGKLLIAIEFRVQRHARSDRLDLVCIELFECAMAHDGALPALDRAMIEVRFILDVVQVRQKLLSIRRQGADVVSLLLALPVFTEAIGKVNIPGALTELVLRMGRQPFNFILVGTFLLVGFVF